MKKRASLAVTAVALSATMIVGATLAYFTANDDSTNYITTGGINDHYDSGVTVWEKQDGMDDYTQEDLTYKNVVQNTDYTKLAKFQNTSSFDAYIAAKVTHDAAVDVTYTADTNWVLASSITTDGTTVDTYYYVPVVASDAETVDLLESFKTTTLAESTSTEINVEAALIQASNVTVMQNGVEGYDSTIGTIYWFGTDDNAVQTPNF